MLLRVLDQPVRVLLLEGKPYWDTKFLVRTLSADPSIRLTSVVQLAEGRLLERNIPPPPVADAAKSPPAAPGDREQWTIETDAGALLANAKRLAPYQVVIVGRNAEAFFTDAALATLRKWLAEGEGSLVCFRGSPAAQISQRLGELMPLRWSPASESRFHVRLTGVGQSLRWLAAGNEGADLLGELPSLATAARPEAAKALAVVLATGMGGPEEAQPVIVYQPVGNGRVVVVEGAGMWRWAFLSPQQQQADKIYGSLWKSLMRWLVANSGLLPSQRLALRPDKLTFDTEENVALSLLTRDWSGQPPRAELAGATLERPRQFACVPRGDNPGQFHLGLGRLPEGRYSAAYFGRRPEGPGGHDHLRRARKPVRAARRAGAAEGNENDGRGKRRRRPGSGRARSAAPAASTPTCAAHIPNARRRRWLGTAGGCCWGLLPFGARAWGLRRRSGLV